MVLRDQECLGSWVGTILLSLLQGPGQVFHQGVQSLCCFFVTPQPVDDHSCQRGPPLSHRVSACRGGGGGVSGAFWHTASGHTGRQGRAPRAHRWWQPCWS